MNHTFGIYKIVHNVYIVWLVVFRHPSEKIRWSSSIGMINDSQYEWENAKNGTQTTNQL